MRFLDPFVVWIRLGLLTHFPIGTKLSFEEHRMKLDVPWIGQGIQRMLCGSNREELNELVPYVSYMGRRIIHDSSAFFKSLVPYRDQLVSALTHLSLIYGNDPQTLAIIDDLRQGVEGKFKVSLHDELRFNSCASMWTDDHLQPIVSLYKEIQRIDSIGLESYAIARAIDAYLEYMDLYTDRIKRGGWRQ